MLFDKSKWIWPITIYSEDDYAEFITSFDLLDLNNVYIRISCDSMYAIYLNGNLIAFSQCADFPNYKFYDQILLNNYLNVGSNELKIQVYHVGVDNQTYIKDKAGLIFEIIQNDNILLYSDELTPSRVMNEYKNGYKKIITSQMGFSFYYDNNASKSLLSKSKLIDKGRNFHLRKIEQLELNNRLPFKIIRQDKKSILIDLGCELAGFLDLDINSKKPQLLTIAYGEHIVDGGVRRIISNRDFSVEVYLKDGNNTYLNPFRRIAGRYLELFFKEELDINYIGIRQVVYPVNIIPTKINDPLIKRINDVAIDTLRLCMHEHYEDCPWREQALYTMDSRNQMLCGYYAFKEYQFPRHNLITIAQSLKENGLLSICAPCGVDIYIPSFSLIYIIETFEYIQHSKDETILDEVKDVLDEIVNTFTKRIDSNNLLVSFPYPCWNFYEWTEGSNNDYQLGIDYKNEKDLSYDFLLNAFYVYAVDLYNKMRHKDIDINKVKDAIKKEFFIDGIYVLSNKNRASSQLANSLAVLIGLGDNSLLDKIKNDTSLIPVSLSMVCFVYDALLKDQNNKEFVINDIKSKYKVMLDNGATSFWETLKGYEDFGGAGSLCHGWSALPIYYFHILNLIN